MPSECGIYLKKLIGTAISIQNSKNISYPSITICTHKSQNLSDYSSTFNDTLLAIEYRAPNGSVQVVSKLLPDVEHRTKIHSHNTLWKYQEVSKSGLKYKNKVSVRVKKSCLNGIVQVLSSFRRFLDASHLICFIRILQGGIIGYVRLLVLYGMTYIHYNYSKSYLQIDRLKC